MSIKRIAVVGGGIFGVTTAIRLSQEGYLVTLFEKEHDIFTHATGINQYRLHRGYHYPRSPETIKSCQKGEPEFRAMYYDAVLDGGIEHYYCVAKSGSSVTVDECRSIFRLMNLPFEDEYPGVVFADRISASFKVPELLYDPIKLKKVCKQYLRDTGVSLLYNSEVYYDDLHRFDMIVVATYSDLNSWSVARSKDYQFEIVEKLVLKLPEIYQKKSVVIFDGRFMCIDPYGDTEYHCMGHVVHAVHHTVTGKKIDIPFEFMPLLNRGVIPNPVITNFDKMIKAAAEFFPYIEKSIHIGSMFTVRTVLSGHEHDDSRPTIVTQLSPRLVTIFSGKIPTCVSAAKEVVKICKNM